MFVGRGWDSFPKAARQSDPRCSAAQRMGPAHTGPARLTVAAGSRAAALAKALRVNERLLWVARAQGEGPPRPVRRIFEPLGTRPAGTGQCWPSACFQDVVVFLPLNAWGFGSLALILSDFFLPSTLSSPFFHSLYLSFLPHPFPIPLPSFCCGETERGGEGEGRDRTGRHLQSQKTQTQGGTDAEAARPNGSRADWPPVSNR